MDFMNWVNEQKKNGQVALDWAKKKYEQSKEVVEDKVKVVTYKPFLDAIVASCALISASDGSLGQQEKDKMAQLLKNSQIMEVFNAAEVMQSFDSIAASVTANYDLGKADCFKAIEGVKGNFDEARQVISFCSIIGSADGDFSDKEQNVIKEICAALELNPKDFNLA